MYAQQAIHSSFGSCRMHLGVRTPTPSTGSRIVRSRAADTQIQTQKALRQLSDLPFEKGLPILGMSPELISKKLQMNYLFERHGGSFTMNFNGERVLCIDNPDQIIEAQTTYQNEMNMIVPLQFMRVIHNGRKDKVYDNEQAKPWKAAMSSVLSPSAVAKLHVPLMIPVITESLQNLTKERECLWFEEMRQVAFKVSIQAVLGDLVPRKDLPELYRLFSVMAAGAISLTFGLRDGVPGTPYYKACKAAQGIEDMLYPYVVEALKDEEALIESNSMLGRFVASMKAEGATNLMGPNSESHAHYFCSEVTNLTFAGTDTTANSLAQVAVQMSKHPEWLERLWEEQQDLMKVYGDELTPEVVNKSTLAAAVGQEVLRLSNPNLFIQRRTNSDIVLGDISVDAGRTVLLYPKMAIRQSNEAEFDPTHWLKPPAASTSSSSDSTSTETECPAATASSNICPFSGRDFNKMEASEMRKLVFGTGPRVCSGQALAVSEMVTVLVVMSRYLKDVKMDQEEQERVVAPIFPHPTGMPVEVVPRF